MAKTTQTARGTILTYVVGIIALACVIAAAADFFFVAQNARYDNEFYAQNTIAAVQSQALPGYARSAVGGSSAAFDSLAGGAQSISQSISLMVNGDATTFMPAASGQVAANVSLLQQHWTTASAAAQSILDSKDSILVANQAAAALRTALPPYIQAWQTLLDKMAAANLPRGLMNTVAGQVFAAQQSYQEMQTLFSGGGNAQQAALAFETHAASFGDVLNALQNGSASLNINALPAIPAVQSALSDLVTEYRSVNPNVQTIASLAAELVNWQQSVATLNGMGPQMLSDTQAITQTYSDQAAARMFKPLYGYVLGGVALLLIILLIGRYQLTSEARRSARAQQEMNERNQQGIMRLLDELGVLADGDLTVELAVTEDITGAIADSINYTVEALRGLVKTINDTALEVDGAARQTQATATQLVKAAETQNREVTSATHAIATMAQSIEGVSSNSSEASQVAQRSVDIAHKGGDAVRRTIEGMAEIREGIQETSKRMKRLGESSQEIGDIIELINDIAEQTNILALNAAIQASTAGEAGRGFGVVADEVQRLAVRAASATRQIETLVHTIQSDTNEAIVSMEQSTASVVSRAQLAEDAGHALDEIESVSHDIAALVQNISGAAGEQAHVAGDVSDTMSVIQRITTQAVEGTAATAQSIGRLATLAAELRRSVAGFKLPGSAPQQPSPEPEEETVEETETLDFLRAGVRSA